MPSREGSRVFIGNLTNGCRERDIEKFFDKYGRVRHIFIKDGKYGFCEFDDIRDAEDAIHDLNGRNLMGERVTVEHAKGHRRERFGPSGGGRGSQGGGFGGDRFRAKWVDKYGPPQRTNYRVIVENLSSRVSWQDLKDLMRRAGEVSYANAHADRRNEGVVEFASKHDMERAIDKYDEYELHGRHIKMVRDVSKSHSRSRSISRSRSRSRTRSRSKESRHKRSSRKSNRSHSSSRSQSREHSRESIRRKRSHSRSVEKDTMADREVDPPKRRKSDSKSPREDSEEKLPRNKVYTDGEGSRSRHYEDTHGVEGGRSRSVSPRGDEGRKGEDDEDDDGGRNDDQRSNYDGEGDVSDARSSVDSRD